MQKKTAKKKYQVEKGGKIHVEMKEIEKKKDKVKKYIHYPHSPPKKKFGATFWI